MSSPDPLELLGNCPIWQSIDGGTLVVACSGGRDSVALACTAAELLADGQFTRQFNSAPQLVLWHLDHGIRTDSQADARFVVQLGQQLGVQVIVERAELSAQSGNLEELARNERYTRLVALLTGDEDSGFINQPSAVVTAHHLGDQAETILHHIIRGTHLRGMRGISARLDNLIYRPWLELPVTMIESYLDLRKQDWREDSTNQDTKFTRNFIRHKVMPLLSELNPEVESRLARLSRTARDAVRYFEQQLEQLEVEVFSKQVVDRWLPLVSLPGAEYSAIRLEEGWQPELALSYVARWFEQKGASLTGGEFDQLDRWEVESGQAVNLRDYQCRLDHQRVLTIRENKVREIECPPLSLNVGDRSMLGGLEVSLEQATSAEWQRFQLRDRARWEKISDWSASIDLLSASPPQRPGWSCFLPAQTQFGLELRDWREGDRIRLAGGGTKKIGDIFTDARIPGCFRSVWAILCDANGEILWVPGLADSTWMKFGEGELPAYRVTLRETL